MFGTECEATRPWVGPKPNRSGVTCQIGGTMTETDRNFLTGLFQAAVDAANPDRALAGHLPPRPKGRVVVIGAGKGAAQLAAEIGRASCRERV